MCQGNCKCKEQDKSWYEKVKDFHMSFNHPVEEKPTLILEGRAKARADWMNEEVEEFLEATTVEEQADAMIDLMYFALGTLVEMGVRPEPLFDIVQHANMSKLWEDGKPHYRADGKVQKPSTWVDPEPLLQEEIKRQLS